MSKMSELHMELSEQASELGFESIEEAEAHGYTVKYSGDEAFLVPDIDKIHKKIHEAWVKERDEVLNGLKSIVLTDTREDRVSIERAINFIKEQCHD